MMSPKVIRSFWDSMKRWNSCFCWSYWACLKLSEIFLALGLRR